MDWRSNRHALDEVVESLYSNPQTTRICVVGSHPTIKARGELAKALAGTSSLREVILERCIYGPKYTTVIKALRSHTQIRVLNLGDNRLDIGCRKLLQEVLLNNRASLEILELHSNSLVGFPLAEHIDGLTNLRQLKIGSSNLFDEAMAEVLQRNTTLLSLNLAQSWANSHGSEVFERILRDNTTLRSLDLKHEQQYGQSPDMMNLQPLMAGLAVNRGLRWLKLDSHRFRETDLSSALSVNRSLRFLSIAWTRPLVGVALQGLRRNSTLWSLDLSGNRMDGVALAGILRENVGLRTLTLVDCNIGTAGAMALAVALAENSTLQRLDLTHNDLGEESGAALADALCRNRGLRSLNLKYTGTTNAEPWAAVLGMNTTLRVLDLSNNNLNMGCDLLGAALEGNSTLRQLSMSNSRQPAGWTRPLACALRRNSSLRKLDLSHGQLNCDDAKGLAAALCENSMLCELDLSANDIKAKGAGCFVETIRVNRSLRMLNLGCYGFGDPTLMALLRAAAARSVPLELYGSYTSRAPLPDIHANHARAKAAVKLQETRRKMALLWGIAQRAHQRSKRAPKRGRSE